MLTHIFIFYDFGNIFTFIIKIINMKFLTDEYLIATLSAHNVSKTKFTVDNETLYYNQSEVGTDNLISIFKQLKNEFTGIVKDDLDEFETINFIDKFESKIYQKLSFSEKIEKFGNRYRHETKKDFTLMYEGILTNDYDWAEKLAEKTGGEIVGSKVNGFDYFICEENIFL